jgi:hypothetical protein
MNQNLQNLVSQVKSDVSGKWISIDQVDKLAALVVNQCVSICEQGTATQTTCSGAAEQIKQYFGLQTPDQESDS